MQHPVDAVTHPEPVLERLDVDVRSPRLHRPADQQIHQADDRRLAGEVAQALDVLDGPLIVGPAAIIDDLADGGGSATVDAFDRAFDFRRYPHPRYHRLGGDQLHGPHGIGIEGIGHGEDEALGRVGEGNDAGFPEETGAHLLIEHRFVRIVPGADQRHMEPERQDSGHVALGDHAELGEDDVEPFAAFAAKAKGALEPGGVELALGQEPFAKRLFEPLRPVLIAGNEFPGAFGPCRRCPGFHPRSSVVLAILRFFSNIRLDQYTTCQVFLNKKLPGLIPKVLWYQPKTNGP